MRLKPPAHHKTLNRKGRPPIRNQDGCFDLKGERLYKTCFECPEEDCIAVYDEILKIWRVKKNG